MLKEYNNMQNKNLILAYFILLILAKIQSLYASNFPNA